MTKSFVVKCTYLLNQEVCVYVTTEYNDLAIELSSCFKLSVYCGILYVFVYFSIWYFEVSPYILLIWNEWLLVCLWFITCQENLSCYKKTYY